MPGRYCLHLWLQTIFDGYITAFAATPPLSGWWHASTPLSTRNLRLFFRLLMPGRCAPSFSPKPLTSLTAASPTHRGERMHGVTPIGCDRIIRSGCVGSPLIPPQAARLIPPMPELPSAHGKRGRRLQNLCKNPQTPVAPLYYTTPLVLFAPATPTFPFRFSSAPLRPKPTHALRTLIILPPLAPMHGKTMH